MNERTGILLSAHGTVENLDDLPGFLARIRRGRPVPPALLEETRHRYELIGGSPLLQTTRELARSLEGATGLPVFVGMRLWNPSLQQAITEARDAGITRLISLPLAPQSVQVYHEAAREAAAAISGAPALVEVASWGEEPALLDAFASVIQEALDRFPEADRAGVELVLSAHSLPLRIIAAGDPYEQQFRAMAARVAARFPHNPSRIAFQSQGFDGGDWLGPDLKATFAALASEGKRDVVVAAIGFLGDHVETLYDLDLEAKRLASEAGLRFERAPSLNARDAFVKALTRVALSSAATS